MKKPNENDGKRERKDSEVKRTKEKMVEEMRRKKRPPLPNKSTVWSMICGSSGSAVLFVKPSETII